MKNPIISKDKIDVDFSDDIMKFILTVGTLLCVLIGIWAVSCLVFGIINAGLLQMARGYITAITGLQENDILNLEDNMAAKDMLNIVLK